MAKKIGKNIRTQLDFYALKAKKEGYPARSVYKLEEIQQKFNIIRPGNSVLDIGAAPGSWTLYTHRKLLKGKGHIVSVDLKPLSLSPIPENVTVFTGDAFTTKMLDKLGALGPYNAIISDAAPSTTGIRAVDCMRSQNLAESIVGIIPTHLKPGGSLVIKIYQGGGDRDILFSMKKNFTRVKTFKPQACRKDSFELFLIGTGRT